MADETLDKLRKDYEAAFGKKAFNGWDAAELQRRIAAHVASVTQIGALKVNLGGQQKGPTAPYPSQDDLDAMRDGTYQNRELKSR